jgi:hypothetical protein
MIAECDRDLNGDGLLHAAIGRCLDLLRRGRMLVHALNRPANTSVALGY